MSERLLKGLNGLISFVLVIALLSAGVYAGYCLWDNSQITGAARNVQSQMISLKPVIATQQEDAPPSAEESFAGLLEINEDVRAWLTMDNTTIDYPVLQGATNLSYINTDVYGKFALAGSIFLDARNSKDFSDNYSLLYGHHMENGRMFGDLDLYRDGKFFSENQTGTLITPEKVYHLQVVACIVCGANEDNIFNPQKWDDGLMGLMEYARSDGLHVADDTFRHVLTEIENGGKPQLLCLSTCANDYTDARTIVLAEMTDATEEETK